MWVFRFPPRIGGCVIITSAVFAIQIEFQLPSAFCVGLSVLRVSLTVLFANMIEFADVEFNKVTVRAPGNWIGAV